jgi:hypothetical protein
MSPDSHYSPSFLSCLTAELWPQLSTSIASAVLSCGGLSHLTVLSGVGSTVAAPAALTGDIATAESAAEYNLSVIQLIRLSYALKSISLCLGSTLWWYHSLSVHTLDVAFGCF